MAADWLDALVARLAAGTDTVLVTVARERLGGIQDLIDNNLVYNLGNAMGTTVLVSGPDGSREVPLEQFFLDYHRVDLRGGKMPGQQAEQTAPFHG